MATTKKAKKVVTPIDERETFVSLQKSFSDSDLSVEEKLKILYNLQSADNDIEKLVQLRGELPAEVAALEDEVAEFEAKVEHLKESIEGYNRAIENYKENIIEHDAEIDKYQQQLANIANSREYDSINKELENTNLLRQIDDKNIRDSKDKIAECRERIDSYNDRIAILSEDLEAKRAELEKIKESTASEEAALVGRRDACASKLDERTLSAYNRIRTANRNHLAVVSVYQGNACGGCFNIITPQRLVDIASGKKLVICEHCGRIIVNPDAE